MTEQELKPTNYRLDPSDLTGIAEVMDFLPTLTADYEQEVRAALEQLILEVAHKAERHGMMRMWEAADAWYKAKVLNPKEVDVEGAALEAIFESIRRREGKTAEDLPAAEYTQVLQIADYAVISGLPDFLHYIIFFNQLADQNSPNP